MSAAAAAARVGLDAFRASLLAQPGMTWEQARAAFATLAVAALTGWRDATGEDLTDDVLDLVHDADCERAARVHPLHGEDRRH